MRTATNTPLGANVIIKYPDEITSAYDEDLFVEIINPSAVDGSLRNIEVWTFDKYNQRIVTPASIVMFGGVGRFYFDSFFFTDFTRATIYIYVYMVIWGFNFHLYPKKSIGDIKITKPTLLPFWNGKNVFSSTVPIDIYRNTIDGNVKVTMPAHTKNIVENVEYVFSSSQGAYTEQYTEEYMLPSSGYYISTRKICDKSVYFEWIDDDGLWRSWYFQLKETRVKTIDESKTIVKNISASENERLVLINQKQNVISKLFSSGNETKEVLTILNSIKSSSFVFMGENLERVNVKSEDTTDNLKFDEFIFTVEEKTKTAR